MGVIRFEPLNSAFSRCTVEIDGSTYSSGLVLEPSWSEDETASALSAVAAALQVVQQKEPRMLRAEVAAHLPDGADPALFARCELVSVSASWDTTADMPRIALAYGFDAGVYIAASVHEGTVTSVALND